METFTASCFIALRDLYYLQEQCYDYYICNWFKRFRANNFDWKNKDHRDRPAATDTDLIKNMFTENPRFNMQEIANITNIPNITFPT